MTFAEAYNKVKEMAKGSDFFVSFLARGGISTDVEIMVYIMRHNKITKGKTYEEAIMAMENYEREFTMEDIEHMAPKGEIK